VSKGVGAVEQAEGSDGSIMVRVEEACDERKFGGRERRLDLVDEDVLSAC
jgi:hypothetical protein